MKNFKTNIDFLINNGFDVLEISKGDKEPIFLLTNEFEPPVQGSVHSSPYLSIKGKDVTEFLKDNIYNHSNAEVFKQKLEAFQQNIKDILYKFSDNHYWIHYTKY